MRSPRRIRIQAGERLNISTVLNPTLMFLFIMGIYSGVYVATMYIHCSKPAKNKKIILFVLTLGYVILLWQAFMLWYWIHDPYTEAGWERFTQLSMIDHHPGISGTMLVLRYMMYTISYVLADGLMVWRCFYMSQRSFHGILIPLGLYLIEIGTTIIANIFLAMWVYKPTDKLDEMASLSDGILGVVVAVTSLVTTIVIIRKIWVATGETNWKKMKNKKLARYKHIMEILVQSAAIYSLVATANAVLDFVDTGGDHPNHTGVVAVMEHYLTRISYILPIFATTIMVARLETSSAKFELRQDAAVADSEILNYLDVTPQGTIEEQRSSLPSEEAEKTGCSNVPGGKNGNDKASEAESTRSVIRNLMKSK